MNANRDSHLRGEQGMEEELVTLVKPPDQKDTTYFSEVGPLRFVEGRARVSLSVARQLAAGRPGWSIEP